MDEHGVVCIVIGGMAAVAHGSPTTTRDLDLVPRSDIENMARLSDALRALEARIRTSGVPDGLPFNHDAASLLRGQIWNLVTRFGDLDVIFHPAGFDGFEALSPNATSIDLDGVPVLVAGLDDVIRSKELADRPKDHATLPYLRALRATIAGSRAEPDRP